MGWRQSDCSAGLSCMGWFCSSVFHMESVKTSATGGTGKQECASHLHARQELLFCGFLWSFQLVLKKVSSKNKKKKKKLLIATVLFTFKISHSLQNAVLKCGAELTFSVVLHQGCLVEEWFLSHAVRAFSWMICLSNVHVYEVLWWVLCAFHHASLCARCLLVAHPNLARSHQGQKHSTHDRASSTGVEGWAVVLCSVHYDTYRK